MEYFNHARWSTLVDSASLPALAGAAYEDLCRRYSEPHRHYHTAQHIDDCLRELTAPHTNHSNPSNPIAVEFAIWFHDAIYDPRATDNEEQSAKLACEYLERWDARLSLLVSNLILATKHHVPGDIPDAALLIDIDLSIFGKHAERFADYENKIRREYSWVPLGIYCEKRAAILRKFIERPRIFATPAFYDLYETPARLNLAHSIEVLEERIT